MAIAAMQVELDIFSGRPNPVWELTAAERAKLKSMVRGASPSQSTIDVPGLGYRGFVVHGPDQIRIYRGQILGYGGGIEQYSTTIGIEFDRWLLASGKKHLDAAIYDAVLDALQR